MDNTLLTLTSGIISGGVVAMINQFFSFKKLSKELHSEREKDKVEFNRRIKLETYNYLITNKLERIEILQDQIIEKIRYTNAVFEIYNSLFKSKLPNCTISNEEFEKTESKILSLEQGSKLVEKEINKNINYFPELKKTYNNINGQGMVSLELSIQLVQPQHIIQNFNGKDEFSEEVKRYQFLHQNYKDTVFKFIDLIDLTHEDIINTININD
ncbi:MULTISPECIES: hypothetical protein [Staphylococcus]|uniref:hypothetical protein n=2 Tax=Staphylococcus TaxID=1279 RepID=UPI00085BB8D6|nr:MULTISPECIES: hypothetical protein [Staphylococcus]SCS83556.1 Uncharacterised protein [Staphylococcus cohnii subsp. cohnii]MDQ7109457.1 hypothetical protein [Staphylococcus ureilyticus]OHO39210.1 hypothetical protein HMPREF2586_04850 [Staphylococcus sp. HMSC034G07]OIS30122.1 hypothetical protein RES9_04675 [Staphylococcus cohnii]OIS32096.1 hypothetical protein RES10_05580 [Staphylococcus cohnii]